MIDPIYLLWNYFTANMPCFEKKTTMLFLLYMYYQTVVGSTWKIISWHTIWSNNNYVFCDNSVGCVFVWVYLCSIFYLIAGTATVSVCSCGLGGSRLCIVDTGRHRSDLHDRLFHLNPLIKVMVKPNNSYCISTIKVAIVAVFVPPAWGIELSTVSATGIIVSV